MEHKPRTVQEDDATTQLDEVEMADTLDDFESPYFDWSNDRMFDEPTRRIIDGIANDPRFNDQPGDIDIVREQAPDRDEDEQEDLLYAARDVFELTVRPGLEARALQLVAKALADPGLEALPPWHGERPDYSQIHPLPYQDPDLRVQEEFVRILAVSEDYQRKQEQALARVESEATQLLGKLPRRTRDLLVLSHRNADRESLLAPWAEGVSQRRLSWLGYYAHRTIREEDENLVLDRYSAATKVLANDGWSKKSIADALKIGVGRIDRLLERTSGQDITEHDPLLELVPELRGRGEAWRDARPTGMTKPKPFGRLLIAEKLALAEQSSDPQILVRLAKQRSRVISETLIRRHCLRGDLGEDVFHAMLLENPSMQEELLKAHHQRPLPKGIDLALAQLDPNVLFELDDETALDAKTLGHSEIDLVLAVRDSDIEELERILSKGPESASFKHLVDLLIERPLSKDMLGSDRLLAAIAHAARQTNELEPALALHLITCQSPQILARHVEAARTGVAALSPESVAHVALGGYHLSGSRSREGVQLGARTLWEAADLTVEHSLARSIAASVGRDVASFETANRIYVATSDAIRCFRKSDTIEYTYVHMLLTSTVESEFGGAECFFLQGHPTLGYRRETQKHPLDPDGPDVEAIVWPIPFHPAMYSLDVGQGECVGFVAVSGRKVAIVDKL